MWRRWEMLIHSGLKSGRLIFEIGLYCIAITAIIFRLFDGICQYGMIVGVIRTIVMDCFIWLIVLGWFGLIPGISKFKFFNEKN
jgi:hypothetical protein